MRRLWLSPIGAILLISACTEPRSKQCRDVCRRELECIEETGAKVPFDEKECVAACAMLEHDAADSAAMVRRHIECVSKQQSCNAVLECK
ncbi:MAG: hypothetical protein KF773_00500 [Deltaproteobacteria bacterium]|nr:hypothetical protein [Deltaproteobacteria bacterium]MCW5801322.1 hypothetical protein [Deltaproteobacteria bacterium]